MTDQPRTPNPVAVRRIAAHLWGEDLINLRAAVESFANGWTVVPKDEADTLDVDRLQAAVKEAWRAVLDTTQSSRMEEVALFAASIYARSPAYRETKENNPVSESKENI
jgi:hypothetical protein